MAVEPALLSSEDAAFIEGGVSVVAAARSGANEPTVSRSIGCRVSTDRQQVTIFLPTAQSEALLADIRENGVISVVFSQPTSHRTIQLKGADAAVVPFMADDARLWSAYRQRFAAEVRCIGFSDEFVQAFLAAPSGIVAVAFTPSAAFLQTPGPKAGMPLHTRA